MKTYKEAKSETVAEPGQLLGVLQVAKVVYEDQAIYTQSGGMTLGQMIDRHIAKIVRDGTLVSEIKLSFEGVAQQQALANAYYGRED